MKEAATTIRDAFGEQLARFKAVCLDEEGDYVWEPTMEDMITLYESLLYLCSTVPCK